MKARVLTLCVCLLAGLLPASAKETVALLITEDDSLGAAQYWWNCSSHRPDLPVTDVLAAHFRRRGVKVVASCDQLQFPIHKSYHRKQLKRNDAINLGNAVGADRVVFGNIAWTEADADRRTTSIGLTRQDIDAELTVVDLLSEKAIAEVQTKASGFSPTPVAARESAIRLVLSHIVKRLPQLSKQAPESLRTIRIQLENLTPKALDQHISALRKQRAFQSVSLVQLDSKSAVVAVTPVTSKRTLERYLKNTDLTYTFLP